MSHPLANFAMALFAALPTIAIAVIGIVLSRVKLRQAHAKAKRFATVGFSLMALQAVVGTSVPAYLAMSVAGAGNRLAITNAITLSGLVAYILLVASLIALLLAVLADRNSLEPSRGAI